MATKPFDIAKTKRKTLRTAATNDIKTANGMLANITAENVMDAEAQVAKLERHHADLTIVNQEIVSLGEFTPEQLEGEVNRQFEYRTGLADAVDKLQIRIRKAAPPPAPSAQNFTADTRTKVKTPKLQLTSYDGDPLRWEEFWDDFTCSVDSRTDLTVIDKFKLLKQSLKEEALSVADGYNLTQRNYQEVKDALLDRFGDPQVAIFAHFEALLELSPASHEVNQLVRIRDKCETHIRSLTALGLSEDTYGLVFAPLILSKLPRFVKMDLHRRNGSKRWTLADLREHLKEEISVRTKSDRSFNAAPDPNPQSGEGSKKGKSHQKPPRTSSSLMIQGDKGKSKSGVQFHSKQFGSKTASCVFCGAKHPNWECQKYPTAESRINIARGKCFVCLSDTHMKSSCRSQKSCFYCQKKGHNSSLCYEKFGKPTQSPNAPVGHTGDFSGPDSSNLVQGLNPGSAEFQPANSVHAVHAGTKSFRKPGMAILESTYVQIRGSNGIFWARIVFDNGSTLSFVCSPFASKVGAKILGHDPTKIGRFGDSARKTQMHPVTQLQLPLQDGSELVLHLRQVPTISAPMRLVPISMEEIGSIFQEDEFAGLVSEPRDADIDILIGLDYYYDIVGPEVWRASNGLVVKQTGVGKILTGFLQDIQPAVSSSQQMLISALTEREQDLQNLERFWRVEESGVVDRTDRSDDDLAVELFNKSVRFVNDRYEVKWPFKEDPPNLPVNYQLSLRRLSSVHRKLMKSPDLLSTYDGIFSDQLAQGVIEEAPVTAEGPVHFLPHHAVVIPSRETTKVRLVFDASSKPSSNFQSLNESMYRGPVFLNDLCGLLLRFRLSKYAVSSDIIKAFLQISLNPAHRDCTRFLWLKDPSQPPTHSNLITYRYTRVLFGATASPFLLAATIMHHLKVANTKISNQMMDCTYMDNIHAGYDSTDIMIQYYKEAKALFKSMSMNVHQWYSNNCEFLTAVPDDEKGTRPIPSVLGLKWDWAQDLITCSVGSMDISIASKRYVLKGIATVYDPLGWFSAVTVLGKMLMQELWNAKVTWDEQLSSDFSKQWDVVRSNLEVLPSIALSRRYAIPISACNGSNLDLHVFCDASAKAYSACVYLRAELDDTTFTDLVFAKCRVAPVKQLTIPKLELTAVLMGVRLLGFVESHLKLPIQSKTIWTDSMCTISWIESQKVTTTFVQNKVKEIRQSAGTKFRYVPSDQNPADIGSRGISAAELQNAELWWKGPRWLTAHESQWPLRPHSSLVSTPDVQPEVQLVAIDRRYAAEPVFNLVRYSSLKKLLRVTCYVRRACQKFAGKPCKTGSLSAQELKDSLTFWELRIQKQCFEPMLSDSMDSQWKLFHRQMGVFVDDFGLLRCRGRFAHSLDLAEDSKFPILLPKNTLFSNLVINDCHARVMHFGVKHTLAQLRQRYWISQGRMTVKSVLSKCAICRIQKGGPFVTPDPPPLPSFRASIKRPFSCVGLDYLGPLFVREAGETKKVWVALFTCAVVRAVHLEVVSSLAATDFMLALRRFTSFCGKPHIMVSDNATQFKAADRMLQKEFKRLSGDSEVQNLLAAEGTSWNFIVEQAPWMGGFYERLVGTVKEALKKTLGRWTVTQEELITICYEAAFIINSRPLVYTEDDPADKVLTPLDFLFRSKECFPDGSGEEVYNERGAKADELMQHWRAGQNLLKQFWDAWKAFYLPSLREASRCKSNRGVSDIAAREGVVVLIKEGLPRGQWKIGKIVKIRASADGLARAAEVRLPSGRILARPLKLLYPIEGGIDTDPASDPNEVAGSNRRPNSTQKTPADPNQPQSQAKNDPQAVVSRQPRQAAKTSRELTKKLLASL